MKTIVLVRNNRDGSLCAHVYFNHDNYALQDWVDIFRGVGNVVWVRNVDRFSLEGIF